MLLSPSQYSQAPVIELLREAARGRIPLDRRWLRAILERGESCAADLLAFLREDDEGLPYDLRLDILHIARHLATPAMTPVLVELARHCKDEEWPDLLKEAFRLIGEPALEPLLELRKQLADPCEADEVLASLGVRDPRIFEALAEELDRDPVLGALAFSIYNDPAARPLIERALESATGELERREIRAILEHLGEPREAELPEPFDIWSLYPEEGLPEFEAVSFEDLVALLGSPEPRWRAGAALEIRGREKRTPELEERLLALAREDPDPEVRGACWWALLAGAVSAPLREEVLARLGDVAAPMAERRLLLLGLADTEEDDALVTRWILEFYDEPATRALALEAMRLSANPNFARYVREHLEDTDLEIRRQAVLGLGALGLRSELHRLAALMREPGLRREAMASYAALAPMDLTRSGARRVLRRIEEMADGLSVEEAEMVMGVLDERLVSAGRAPAFVAEGSGLQSEDEEFEPASRVSPSKPGRNEPCPCGSGRKYKRCCGA
ncbi:MAG: HEAT repeat domain-containing protein [Bryobacteraceae bacterium]|nr:HEAT repeat domain-containing protein [Bryobacteraceae bacterium]